MFDQKNLCILKYNKSHAYSYALHPQTQAPLHFLWCDLVTFHAHKYTIITIGIRSMKHVFTTNKFYYKWK